MVKTYFQNSSGYDIVEAVIMPEAVHVGDEIELTPGNLYRVSMVTWSLTTNVDPRGAMIPELYVRLI